MLCFPTGKKAQKGQISPALIGPAEQQHFTRRYLQLKREKERVGAKVMDLGTVPYKGDGKVAAKKPPTSTTVGASECDGGCGKLERRPGEFSQCSRCKKTKYCGKDCQTKHWKAGHKKECK